MPLKRVALLSDVVIPDKSIAKYPAREVGNVIQLRCASRLTRRIPNMTSVPVPSLSPMTLRSATKRGAGSTTTTSPIVKNSKLAAGGARAYASLLKHGVAAQARGTGRIATGVPVVRMGVAMQRGLMAQPVLSQMQHSRLHGSGGASRLG
eukprot:CAMPEP_0183358678 /NCGR_PEP_ID=MMETSP0164_2-20130417/49910_1 /TAXON_ID=221442 /ORGANISM="Coccolithus pelagicus ssp braarudi, Strain PLY182g" /LENGTH=149 /DNA_ID=CAMNT_0025532615 /DNA_START=18 /DNA_END=464 /DNA_ORIENTATION=-